MEFFPPNHKPLLSRYSITRDIPEADSELFGSIARFGTPYTVKGKNGNFSVYPDGNVFRFWTCRDKMEDY